MNDEALFDQLIWRHDWEALQNLYTLPATSWAGSVQDELRRFTLHADLCIPARALPPYLGCAAVMMVKDEADIIYDNLAWLFRMGVRRFVVMDNASVDATLPEINRFAHFHPDAETVVGRDAEVAHFQSEKVTAMARHALERWPDLGWILPVDADEFCIAWRGLAALDEVAPEIDALTVPKAVHFLSWEGAARDTQAASVYDRMPLRCPPFCVPPKMLARARPDLSVGQGNHKLFSDSPIRYAGALSFGIYHREFQTRSFAQFLRKVRNGGRAILAAQAFGREVGGEHWLAWHRLLVDQGEAGLRAHFLRECWRTEDARHVIDPFYPAG